MTVALAVAAGAQPEARITVRASRELGPVNRRVFGNNHVSYDPKDIFSPQPFYDYTNYGAGIWDPEARRPAQEALRLAQEMGIPVARFPGGCGVHSLDWKRTIGPPETRPNWRFGLDEFLRVCEEIGSEPLITVSDYTGTAQDAADLVEYLNAPADPSHPWAQRRAANGHPDPYRVRWFELGNETDHGNHQMTPPRRMTPHEYARWVCEYSARMRAVDPAVKIGALMATAKPPDDPWNHIVLPLVKDAADFIIVHTYAVALWGENPDASPDRLMRAAVAAPDQFEAMLAEYRALVRRHCGRDLPLAITEYNAMFVQERPIPYRFSLGAALFCADYLRVLLKPEANILMANYWQFINEYWGELRGPVRGENVPYIRRPAYHVHWLYHRHFGDTLVAAESESPTFDCEGFGSTLPARGDLSRPAPEVVPGDPLADVQLQSPEGPGWKVTAEGRSLVWRLGRFAGNTYPLLGRFPHIPGRGYRLTGEARLEGDLGGARLGVQIGDDRGWPVTHSAAVYDGVEIFRDWTPFAVDYTPLPDSRGIMLVLRCEDKAEGAAGVLRLRSLKVESVLPAVFPAVKTLTVSASKSADGNTLYLMVVNKDLSRDLVTEVQMDGFEARSAHMWTLTGPAMEATNEENPLNCAVAEADLPHPGSPLRVTFPARSMTAVELRR